MSTVDREPRSSKWRSIHACAQSRPSARSCLRNPRSALSLLAAQRTPGRLLQTSHSLLWLVNAPARAAQFFGRILLGMTRRPLVRCVKPQPPIRRRRQGRHHPVLALSYVYYKSEPGRRAAADLLTRDTIVCAKCRSSGPFDSSSHTRLSIAVADNEARAVVFNIPGRGKAAIGHGARLGWPARSGAARTQ
jgi:hypothetical protein